MRKLVIGGDDTINQNGNTGWKVCLDERICVLVAQSCLTLFDSMDCSPPGSSVHGILQASILEWVTIPSPGDLPDPEIERGSPALQEDSLPSEPPRKTPGQEDSAFCFRHVQFAVSIGHLQFYREFGNSHLKLREIINIIILFLIFLRSVP